MKDEKNGKKSAEKQIPKETVAEASLLRIIQGNSQLPEKNNSGISTCGTSVKMRP